MSEAEDLKINCPHCGQSLAFPADGMGQSVPCPTCSKAVKLVPHGAVKAYRWLLVLCAVASLVEVGRTVKVANPGSWEGLLSIASGAAAVLLGYGFISLAISFFVVWGDKLRIRPCAAIIFLIVLAFVWMSEKW